MIRGSTIGILAGIVIATVIAVTVRPVQPVVPPPTVASAALAADPEEREDEAKRLMSGGGLARREGDALIFSYQNHDVARLSDVKQNCNLSACGLWFFDYALLLRGATNAPSTAYPVVTFERWGGGVLSAIVDHDGQVYWLDNRVLSQVGGRYIASGQIHGVETPNHFYIVDWATPQHSVAWRSQRPCEPMQWLNNDTLQVACRSDSKADDDVAATVNRTVSGWSLTPVGMVQRRDIAAAQDNKPYRLKPLGRMGFAPYNLESYVRDDSLPHLLHIDDRMGKDTVPGYRHLP